MNRRYVGLGYSFEFETSENAHRGAARLNVDGVRAEVRQGRFDGELSDSIWWVLFEDARWISDEDVSWPTLDAEAEQRGRAIERRLADLGCVEALWSVEVVSGGPAEDARPEPSGE
jgi:hypothetical protein